MKHQANRAADADELLSLRLTRVLAAPPERVYAAWTSAELLPLWWGPPGYQGLAAQADPRPGGVFAIEVRDPQGEVHRMAGVYTEVRPSALVCIEIRHRQFPGAAERPEGYIPTQLRVELAAHPEGTELTLIHSGFLDAAISARFQGGWSGSLDKLGSFLAGQANAGETA